MEQTEVVFIIRLFFLVVKHAVAISLKIGIGDLVTKFLAHALVVLGFLEAAGTVSAARLQTFLDSLDELGVLIQSDFHGHQLPFCLFILILAQFALSVKESCFRYKKRNG